MAGIYIPMKLPDIKDNHIIKAEIRNIDGELQFGIMTDGYYCCQQWTYYPLMTVQDHGDLIDRDALKQKETWVFFDEWGNMTAACDALDSSPVVIPANKEEL